MLNHIQRYIYLLFGFLFVTLAIFGIVLPLLPTTPFLLLAAFCFSKSSPALHRWLLSNRWLGPVLSDWERFGVIRFQTKIIATSMMIVLVSYPLIFVIVSFWIKMLIIAVIFAVLLFIWTRPSYKHEEPD